MVLRSETLAPSRPVVSLVVCRTLTLRAAVAILAGSVGLIVASSSVAWGGSVPVWEAEVLNLFNGWPDWLEPVMWALQLGGVLAAPVVAGVFVVLFTRDWRHLVPFVLVLPLKLGVEKGLLKQLVQRERPFVSVGPEVHVRGSAFEGLSFPSGHTTTAFAVGILVAAFLPPRWRPVPLMWAAIVGVARMYDGEHNFLDVMAGAAMGTAFAAILWFVFLNRPVEPARDRSRS